MIRRCGCCWKDRRFRTERPRKCAACKRARCGGDLCDVEELRTRDPGAVPPVSWSRDRLRRVAALEELRADLSWWEWLTSQPDGPEGVQIPFLEVYERRVNVRVLDERRRDDLPASWRLPQNPTWYRL